MKSLKSVTLDVEHPLHRGGDTVAVAPRGGPGTRASAGIARTLVTHTAVMRRKAIVHMSRSMNGIMLISLFVARLCPPDCPHVDAPPLDVLLAVPLESAAAGATVQARFARL